MAIDSFCVNLFVKSATGKNFIILCLASIKSIRSACLFSLGHFQKFTLTQQINTWNLNRSRHSLIGANWLLIKWKRIIERNQSILSTCQLYSQALLISLKTLKYFKNWSNLKRLDLNCLTRGTSHWIRKLHPFLTRTPGGVSTFHQELNLRMISLILKRDLKLFSSFCHPSNLIWGAMSMIT